MRFRRARGFAPTPVSNEGYVLRRFLAWYGDVQMRAHDSRKVSDWFTGKEPCAASIVAVTESTERR